MLNIPNKVPGDTHFSYEFNSYVDELENIVTDVNSALNGADSHQVGQSMAVYGATGNYFVDAGIANALSLVSSQYGFQVPKQYYDGMLVRCLPAFTNTGASTMNVAGLGNKNIRLSGGDLPVPAGAIVAGVMTSFYYSLAFDCMIYLGATELNPATVPIGYFSPGGFLSSDNGTIMTFGPGACADSTNQQIIYNPTSFTKDYTSTWVAGSGNGGVPSAVTLSINTYYYDFVISKPDGTVDFGLDTDINATNLLADATGFTRFRRLRSHITQLASTNIESMYQVEREFYFLTYRVDYTDGSLASGNHNYNLPISIPLLTTNCLALVVLEYHATSSDPAPSVDVYPPLTPFKSQNIAATFGGLSTLGVQNYSGISTFRVYSNDQTVNLSITQGTITNGDLQLTTIGWADYLTV